MTVPRSEAADDDVAASRPARNTRRNHATIIAYMSAAASLMTALGVILTALLH